MFAVRRFVEQSRARFTSTAAATAVPVKHRPVWHIVKPGSHPTQKAASNLPASALLLFRGRPVNPSAIADMAKPTKVEGVWRGPVITSRMLKKLRNLCIQHSVPYPMPTVVHRPVRGHTVSKGSRHDREKAARNAATQQQLVKMDDIIAQKKKATLESRKATGVEGQIKQLRLVKRTRYSLDDLVKDLD